MSSDFDQLVSGEQWDRPMDTHEAIHLYGALILLVPQLGAWDAERAQAESDPEYLALRLEKTGEVDYGEGAERTAALSRRADRMGDAARRFAKRMGEWVDSKGIGPLYLYVHLPCCDEVAAMIVGGGPARFYDEQLDAMPVRPYSLDPSDPS